MAPVRDFLPDELLAEDDAEQEVDHKVLKRVAVTDIAFLTKSEVGVMTPRSAEPRSGGIILGIHHAMVNRPR